jgi:hypothetical protein
MSKLEKKIAKTKARLKTDPKFRRALEKAVRKTGSSAVVGYIS